MGLPISPGLSTPCSSSFRCSPPSCWAYTPPCSPCSWSPAILFRAASLRSSIFCPHALLPCNVPLGSSCRPLIPRHLCLQSAALCRCRPLWAQDRVVQAPAESHIPGEAGPGEGRGCTGSHGPLAQREEGTGSPHFRVTGRRGGGLMDGTLGRWEEEAGGQDLEEKRVQAGLLREETGAWP